jgi:YegS/Rv2252/BmrU family lipid kinase
MQNPGALKLFFVINPISGGKEKNDWEKEIREFLKDSPHTMDFYLLTGKGDKPSLQHYLDVIKPDRVIAVGGDGTVKMVATLVKETSMALGILPAGSANGMAKELNIPLIPAEALKVVTEGECRKIDLLRINEEELCIHLSDIGLNAMLVKYFEQSGNRGMSAYGKAVFKVLWEKQKMRVQINTTEEACKRKAYMVVLANARKYGTGANINPEGSVDDGFFEVVVVRKLNLLEIFKSIFTDHSFHPRRIEVFKTREVTLKLQKKAYFQIDGEFMGKTTAVHARILPGILNVMLPRPSG